MTWLWVSYFYLDWTIYSCLMVSLCIHDIQHFTCAFAAPHIEFYMKLGIDLYLLNSAALWITQIYCLIPCNTGVSYLPSSVRPCRLHESTVWLCVIPVIAVHLCLIEVLAVNVCLFMAPTYEYYDSIDIHQDLWKPAQSHDLLMPQHWTTHQLIHLLPYHLISANGLRGLHNARFLMMMKCQRFFVWALWGSEQAWRLRIECSACGLQVRW